MNVVRDRATTIDFFQEGLLFFVGKIRVELDFHGQSLETRAIGRVLSEQEGQGTGICLYATSERVRKLP